MASVKPPIELVLDFDGTITMSDTTAIIGSRCLAKACKLAPEDLPSDKRPKSMEFYSQQYFKDYQVWRDSYTWAQDERKTVSDEIRCLSQSKEIEQASFSRVRDAIFGTPGKFQEMAADEGWRNNFMMQAGRDAVRTGEVRIRDADGLRTLLAQTYEWGIVSVSWSRRFILGVLLEAGLIRAGDEEDVAKRIRCNEILAPIHHDGDLRPVTISTASDKKDAFEDMLDEWNTFTAPKTFALTGIIRIYTGDSTTDIGCLAGAVLGMYMSDNSLQNDTVIETLKRLDVEVLNLVDLPISEGYSWIMNRRKIRREEDRPASIVCTVKDFQEISDWLSNFLDPLDPGS